MSTFYKPKCKKMPKSFEILTAKQIFSVIQEEGYFPRIDDDRDVSFKIKGTTFIFGVCANGFVYGRIYFNLRKRDKWPAIMAAQHVELSYIAIKTLVVTENESLIFSVESFCNTVDSFRLFFPRALSILSDSSICGQTSRTFFRINSKCLLSSHENLFGKYFNIASAPSLIDMIALQR